ncbi:unnamed protein product [Linum trigynum]|uniref:Uncharacterized protein n=1 Tax=Linum trigynum TaxID=586398 RepID=A0AAV2GQM3_9ROSI
MENRGAPTIPAGFHYHSGLVREIRAAPQPLASSFCRRLGAATTAEDLPSSFCYRNGLISEHSVPSISVDRVSIFLAGTIIVYSKISANLMMIATLKSMD